MTVSFMTAAWATVVVGFMLMVLLPGIVVGFASDGDMTSVGARSRFRRALVTFRVLGSLWVVMLGIAIWVPVFIGGLY